MLDDDTAAVITRAKQQGISILLNVCVDLDKAKGIIDITKHDCVYASVGQHPCSAQSGGVSLVERILDLVNSNKKVIAIGETGLDFYRETNPSRKAQLISLEAHIEAARRSRLPLIIHSRNSDEIVDVIRANRDIRFVMHCFSGSMELARKCLDLGGYISFSGIITFKNANDLREICRFVPLDRMLIETDAPYLAPVPHRGKPNEPSYMRATAEFMANIRKMSLIEFAAATTTNFTRLFKINLEQDNRLTPL